MERLNRLFKRECVSNELLQVENFAPEQVDSGRPGVMVSVDEAKIDLRACTSAFSIDRIQ